MGELQNLPNIGTVMEEQLRKVGIDTVEQLKAVGSKEAWLRILAMDPSACMNRLCGLEGAIRNIRWYHLDKDIKQDLSNFYHQHKG